MNLGLNIETLLAISFISIVVIQLYKAYLVRKKNKRRYRYEQERNTSITNQNLKMYAIEKSITDRIDKMEVDIAYIKNFSIKADSFNNPQKIKDMKLEEMFEKPDDFKSPLVELLKEDIQDVSMPKYKKVFNPRPLIPFRKRLFTDAEIDEEIRNKKGLILSNITAKDYKSEYDRAYKRLYYQKVTKVKKKK